MIVDIVDSVSYFTDIIELIVHLFYIGCQNMLDKLREGEICQIEKIT